MAAMGLALLALVAAGLALTGLPAFLVLIGAAGLGAGIAFVGGAPVALLGALPGRLTALLESDLLQALPLYVLMGALLDRLPLAEALYRGALAVLPRTRAAPVMAALGLGAVLGPMNGSVGASVAVLSRVVRPRLALAGVPGPESIAAVAAASTLGVVVPPSLVLILLGDAAMGAHTLALAATGRREVVLNTGDLFRGALAPAALFLALALLAAWLRPPRGMAVPPRPPLSLGQAAAALGTLAFVVGLLGGVATGRLYAVEAAAAGGVGLLAFGLASRTLTLEGLRAALDTTLAVTGALFALLVAATTMTLVLRVLGTDALVAGVIAGLPGGPFGATLLVLGMIGLAAFVLDAFELVVVVVPIVLPPLLMRGPDPLWVTVLILLTLQASFLLPPFGYALLLARSGLANPPPLRAVARALVPYLAAGALTLGATLAYPPLVRLGAPAPRPAAAPLGEDEIRRRFDAVLPGLPETDAPPGFDAPKRP